MIATFSIRSAAIAVSTVAAMLCAPVLAQGADNEQAEEGSGAVIARPASVGLVEFSVDTAVLKAQMPCEDPAPGPPGLNGQQSSLCILGDRMFVFAVSSGSSPIGAGPLGSDFDGAFEEVQSSGDTDFIEEVEVDGRRVMRATRNPEAGYGVMQAVEFASDSLAYVISMSRPNPDRPLTETDRQEMRDFVASLEIVQ